jgi:hypothetical protein
MGSKSAPAPFMPVAAPPPPAVDRKELDKETLAAARERVGKTSTKDGEEDPQATLLSERKFWSDKEKEQQKKKTLLN